MDIHNLETTDVCELVTSGRITAIVVDQEVRYHLDAKDLHEHLVSIISESRCSELLIGQALEQHLLTNPTDSKLIEIDLHTSILSNHDFIDAVIQFSLSKRLHFGFKLFGSDKSMSNIMESYSQRSKDLLRRHDMLLSIEQWQAAV